MGCIFSVFRRSSGSHEEHDSGGQRIDSSDKLIFNPPLDFNLSSSKSISAQKFTFRDLATATYGFAEDCFLGEGGFGRVYKGRLEYTNQVVAIKQLNPSGYQGNQEFIIEATMLSFLHHPNLVNLIGYCSEGDQRLLVYEYMCLGSLADHLYVTEDQGDNKEVLDWNTRMKVAAGAAKGVEYLHNKAEPPVIYRDLKCSNILLGENFHPKLSDFGLAKFGPVGDDTHVSTRVMGTYGYCAPEYAMSGQLTTKSDIYSFGVVLLEIISGKKAIDISRPPEERNLVSWARPLCQDRKKFFQLADPLLRGRYPSRSFHQVLAIARLCIHEEARLRPSIADVVDALSFLADQKHEPNDLQASVRSESCMVESHNNERCQITELHRNETIG